MTGAGPSLRRGLVAAGIALALAMAGCATTRTDPTVRVEDGWRSVATPQDRSRIRNWYAVFTDAVARARRTDEGAAAIAADPALFDPARQARDPVPPVGGYRCRVVKLGAAQAGMLEYIAYGWFRCRVDGAMIPGGRVRLTKITGSQRHVGDIWPDEPTRGVFLGTLVLGDEREAQAYGRDPTRDVAAIVHRIDTARWRVAIIQPAFESRLDLLELVPDAVP